MAPREAKTVNHKCGIPFDFMYDEDPKSCGYSGPYSCTLSGKIISTSSEPEKPNTRIVAIRRLRPELISTEAQSLHFIKSVERMKERVIREVNILKGLDHENIIRILGVSSPESLAEQEIIFEPWHDESLADWIKRDTPPEYPNRVEVVKQVASGLQYLHSKLLVHGDIKSANIIIGEDNKPVIIEFSLCSFIKQGDHVAHKDSRNESNSRSILLKWMSPERHDDYSVSVGDDVYAFGCVILHCLTGKEPYHYVKSDYDFYHARYNREPPSSRKLLELSEVTWNEKHDWWPIMERCWLPFPEQTDVMAVGVDRHVRPNISQIQKEISEMLN